MYAVIFRAEINVLDQEYFELATRTRNLAIREYGCSEFISTTEGNMEIAISYWENQDQIKKWKQNPEHVAAQEKSRSKWYKSTTVQVVDIVREYGSDMA